MNWLYKKPMLTYRYTNEKDMLMNEAFQESWGWWDLDNSSSLIGPLRDYGKGDEYHNTEASVIGQEFDRILFTHVRWLKDGNICPSGQVFFNYRAIYVCG